MESDNVITIKSGLSDEVSRKISQMQAYWSNLRRGSDVPRRSEIDPRKVEACLENAFIAERVAPGVARLRIAGSHLVDLMSMEVRGMPMSAFFELESRARLSETLKHVFDKPATAALDLVAPRGGIRGTEIVGQALFLPLRSDLGDISRIMGCLVMNGKTGRNTTRLEIRGSRVAPISARTQSPELRLHSAIDVSARTHVPRSGDRPYLRLVKSDA